MKSERQTAIRNLLRERSIQTQEELAAALRSNGFQVTQATVSRDMKEMHLIKVPSAEGGYQYAVPETKGIDLSERLTRMLRDCMISAEAAGQMVVVKTISGSAGTAAEALDNLQIPGILGSIAGDNTIFLAARDPESASGAADEINWLIR